eukprot:3381674-Pyramimonas_sp.AAC.3
MAAHVLNTACVASPFSTCVAKPRSRGALKQRRSRVVVLKAQTESWDVDEGGVVFGADDIAKATGK